MASKETHLGDISFAVLARLLAIGMLVWALDRHAYGYYALLRIVTCVVAAYCATLAKEYKKDTWTITLGIIAVVFNPIIPFRMSRSAWNIIDVIAAGIFLISLVTIRKAKAEN